LAFKPICQRLNRGKREKRVLYLSFVGSNLNFFSKDLFDNLIVGRFWNSTVSPHRPSSPYRN
jgi:hypothetical protein